MEVAPVDPVSSTQAIWKPDLGEIATRSHSL